MAIIITDKCLFTLNSTVVLVSPLQTNKRNCSQTEQFSRHSPTTSVSDGDFVQSTPKEELSLDQAVNIGNRESCEFHVIHFGSSITMRIPHNSHHFSCLPSGKECIEQEHESRKFRVIHLASAQSREFCIVRTNFVLSLDSAENQTRGSEIRPIRVFVYLTVV